MAKKDTTYDSVLYTWKKHNIKKDYQKHIATSELLKAHSVELVDILINNKIIKDGMKIFEIGCGMGRNLSYIDKKGFDIEYFGNDLIKDECFKYMEKSLKDKINFIEKETSLLFEDKYEVDLFISACHLMHLIPFSVPHILEKLMNEWKPKYILLLETTKPNTKGKRKWVHDYSVLDDKYDYICKVPSRESDNYIIRLLKRK